MKKKTEKPERGDGLRREYRLSKLKRAVRSKYTARYRAGTNLVLLSPDVAEYFPDEQSVNSAWRTLIRAAKRLSAARARPTEQVKKSHINSMTQQGVQLHCRAGRRFFRA
jgi:hypothetical protein